MIEESKVISELQNLVDVLAKVCVKEKKYIFRVYFKYCPFTPSADTQLAAKPVFPESLQQLVEMVKYPASIVGAPSAINVGKEDKGRISKDKKVGGDFFIICVFFPALTDILLWL